ncbi:DUF975 family protein [Sporolactobacillus kofuensis]|uniref:DUF975 family protein n=1 Tax=Sporolactobacillus kofuensis TaxID=269672 RepID=A0ABW1WFC4_9BACL|nr:DUF975 family protein [Sporolactobacillus kofuensis]MCO7176191.1 DUF975 family protein [Sporolactobacillus kofuensis]
MRISEIKQNARTLLQGYSRKSGVLVLVLFLISTLPPYLVDVALSGGFQNWANQTDSSPLSYFFQMIYAMLLFPMNIASMWFFLELIREQDPKISILFTIYNNGKRVLKLIWVNIFMAILLFLWFLLLIIPGIIKAFSYSQVFYILYDHPEYSASKAIKESKKLMNGHKWKLFLLGLSFIGWCLLTSVPVIAGIIVFAIFYAIGIKILAFLFLAVGSVGSIWMYLWLIPYISTSMATFYEWLIRNNQTGINDAE